MGGRRSLRLEVLWFTVVMGLGEAGRPAGVSLGVWCNQAALFITLWAQIAANGVCVLDIDK